MLGKSKVFTLLYLSIFGLNSLPLPHPKPTSIARIRGQKGSPRSHHITYILLPNTSPPWHLQYLIDIQGITFYSSSMLSNTFRLYYTHNNSM